MLTFTSTPLSSAGGQILWCDQHLCGRWEPVLHAAACSGLIRRKCSQYRFLLYQEGRIVVDKVSTSKFTACGDWRGLMRRHGLLCARQHWPTGRQAQSGYELPSVIGFASGSTVKLAARNLAGQRALAAPGVRGRWPEAPVEERLRDQIWLKLVGNVAVQPGDARSPGRRSASSARCPRWSSSSARSRGVRRRRRAAGDRAPRVDRAPARGGHRSRRPQDLHAPGPRGRQAARARLHDGRRHRARQRSSNCRCRTPRPSTPARELLDVVRRGSARPVRCCPPSRSGTRLFSDLRALRSAAGARLARA